MEVFLKNKELNKLYLNGSSSKLKLPEHVIEKFFVAIQKIEEAVDIYDLWNDTALNFEKMKGFENRYSIRLKLKYRLEMEIEWINDNKTLGQFYLDRISLHYQ